MKPTTAIEILDHFQKKLPYNRSRDYAEALKEGIKALKEKLQREKGAPKCT